MSGGGSARNDYAFKVLVVGDPRVGKTSIINRYVHGQFSMHYKLTLGVDFALKVHTPYHDSDTSSLRDIAGQEKAGTMTRVYYRDASAAIVVFDSSRAETLESVKEWKKDIDSKLVLPDGRRIPAVLLANKCDLPAAPGVTEDALNALIESESFVAWFLTSAKDDTNINEAANFLVDQAIADYEATRKFVQEERSRSNISLTDEPPRRSCSC